jgi:hypothetical protein
VHKKKELQKQDVGEGTRETRKEDTRQEREKEREREREREKDSWFSQFHFRSLNL